MQRMQVGHTSSIFTVQSSLPHFISPPGFPFVDSVAILHGPVGLFSLTWYSLTSYHNDAHVPSADCFVWGRMRMALAGIRLGG